MVTVLIGFVKSFSQTAAAKSIAAPALPTEYGAREDIRKRCVIEWTGSPESTLSSI